MSCNMPKPSRRKIIIDADPGVDDTVAILSALGCEHLEVIGLTTIFGNIPTTTATDNGLRLLTQLNRLTIPVCHGADQSWSGQLLDFPVSVHGKNGMGDIEIPPAKIKAHEKSAADFIVEMCDLYPEQISLLFLGPLTNLANALMRDPKLPQKWDQVVILGGAFFVNGNVSPVAEANMANDPEAADFVVQRAPNVRVVGLNVTMQCPLSSNDLQEISQFNTTCRWLREIYQLYLQNYLSRFPELNGAPPHDAIALMALIDPTLFDWKTGPIRVSTNGICRGQTILSMSNYKEENPWTGVPHCKVAMGIQPEAVIRQIKVFLSQCT